MPVQFPSQFSSPNFPSQPSYDPTSILVGVVAIVFFAGLYYYRRSLLSERQVDILRTPPHSIPRVRSRFATPGSPETPTNSGEWDNTVSGSTDLGETDDSFDFSSSEDEPITPKRTQPLDRQNVKAPKRTSYTPTPDLTRSPFWNDHNRLDRVKTNLNNLYDTNPNDVGSDSSSS